MYVKGQPAMRMAARYDESALGILAGDGVLFPAQPDPARTGILARPPGYAALLALLYRTLGRSFFEVQLLQNLANSLGTLLVIALGATLAGDLAGLLAGLLYALSPHLAFCANLVLPDSLCPLVLLLGVVLALPSRFPGAESPGWRFLAAGVILGAAAWLRPNMVGVAPLLALALFVGRTPRSFKVVLLPLGAALAVLPITVRNYSVFHEFVPISINGGLTLWEGIAEAGGQKYGARRGDKLVMEEEAERYHNPRYAEWWAEPDGIARDRDRARRSAAVIAAHPLWYARAMASRMGRMLDYWSPPPPEVEAGGGGIASALGGDEEAGADRETPFERREDLAPPPRWSEAACLLPGRLTAPARGPVRILQRTSRYLTLPAILAGTLILGVRDWRRALLLSVVPLYCLATESFMLLEWRVVASMHVFLFVAAGAGLAALARTSGAEGRRA
jgi:hypothetical protein